MNLICAVFGHKAEYGHYWLVSGHYTMRRCERCKVHLGMTEMTNEYREKHYPEPKELMADIKRVWEYHEAALSLKHNRGSFVLYRIAADGSRRPVCRFRVKEC